jgi:microcystin-dependent protein
VTNGVYTNTNQTISGNKTFSGTATFSGTIDGIALVNKMFPVGSVYITATNPNPGTFLGGTWTQIAQGRTLIGVGTLGDDTYAAGDVGGAARVTLGINELPSHNHGGTTGNESANHTHSGTTASAGTHTHTTPLSDGGYFQYSGGGGTSGINIPLGADGTTSSAGAHTHTFTTNGVSANHTHSISAQGGGGAHENRMPYLAVYFWQRTA